MADAEEITAWLNACSNLHTRVVACVQGQYAASTGIPCLSSLKGRTQLQHVSREVDCAKLMSMLGGDQQMLVLLRHSLGMHLDQSYDPKKPGTLPVTPSWKASHHLEILCLCCFMFTSVNVVACLSLISSGWN